MCLDEIGRALVDLFGGFVVPADVRTMAQALPPTGSLLSQLLPQSDLQRLPGALVLHRGIRKLISL